MPRIRTFKPEFFTSPDTAKVTFAVRIFYMSLWSWADDFGVGETNLNGILGHAFPDSDGFTRADLRGFCADVAQHYGVVFYTVRGRHYFYIPSWEKHQKLERREERRKYPTPDDPEATPDLRFQPRADSAPTSGAESGKSVLEGEREWEGEGEAELEEPPYPPQRERAAELVPLRKTGTDRVLAKYSKLSARSAPAHQIAQAFSESLPNPIQSDVLGEIAVQIDKCLTDAIPPEAIAHGIHDWANSDSWSPTQIPRFVAKATAKAGSHGKATRKALDYDAAAEQLIAELGSIA